MRLTGLFYVWCATALCFRRDFDVGGEERKNCCWMGLLGYQRMANGKVVKRFLTLPLMTSTSYEGSMRQNSVSWKHFSLSCCFCEQKCSLLPQWQWYCRHSRAVLWAWPKVCTVWRKMHPSLYTEFHILEFFPGGFCLLLTVSIGS